MRPWDEITSEIQASCDACGVEWHELRCAVVDRHLEENPWPEDEGLGSSDMNHILVGEWESNREGVLATLEKVEWQKQTLARLEADGVDLEQMAKLFAPAEYAR